MTFPHPRRIPPSSLILQDVWQTGDFMIIEMRTKRRWIVSVLEAVAEQQDGPTAPRAFVKHTSGRTMPPGQKGFAMRLKAATRPLAAATR